MPFPDHFHDELSPAWTAKANQQVKSQVLENGCRGDWQSPHQ
jgi:hypothetical protein